MGVYFSTHSSPADPYRIENDDTLLTRFEVPLVPVVPPPPASRIETKHTLVILDLDETLFHCFATDKYTAAQLQFVRQLACEQRVEYEQGLRKFEECEYHAVQVGPNVRLTLQIRPHLWTFLAQLFDQYTVGVWSAGGDEYVKGICRFLFPAERGLHPVFQLNWHDCVLEDYPLHYCYTKSLDIIARRFPHLATHLLILVDNRVENAYHFPAHLVHVPDFNESPWESGAHSADNFLQVACLEQILVRRHDLYHAGSRYLTSHSHDAGIDHRWHAAFDRALHEPIQTFY